MKIKFKHFAPIVFFITILIINFHFANNQYFKVHDWTAGARIFDQHQAFKDGHFPPRWAVNHGFGYGMPLFQFYAPLAFYLAEIFQILNFSILTSLKLTYFSISILGFIGSYLLAKKLTNKWGGLISAVAFSLATYHAVNIYVRGALAEFLAISLMPWTLFYILKIIDPKKNFKHAYLGLTLSLSAFFLSHNVSLLTFLPFWGLITLFLLSFLSEKKHIGKNIFKISLSFLNAFLIAAFFLLPSYIQKDYTRVDSLTDGFSQYPQHFLYFRQLFIPNWGYGGSIGGPDDDMSFYLGNEILLLTLIAGIAVLKKYFSKNRNHKQKQAFHFFIFFSILFLVSVFLTSFKSQFIWDQLPMVSFIQFPWRFIGVSSFILSLLISYLAVNSDKSKTLVILGIISIFIFSGKYFRPDEIGDQGEIYNPNPEFIQNRMSGILPDYLPPEIDWQNISPPKTSVEIKQGSGDINLSTEKTHQLIASLNLKTDSIIKINRFVFPNWQIRLNNQTINCPINEHIYECEIVAGEHQLEFSWSETGINQLSNYLSILGIIILYLLVRQKSIFSNPKLSSNSIE